MQVKILASEAISGLGKDQMQVKILGALSENVLGTRSMFYVILKFWVWFQYRWLLIKHPGLVKAPSFQGDFRCLFVGTPRDFDRSPLVQVLLLHLKITRSGLHFRITHFFHTNGYTLQIYTLFSHYAVTHFRSTHLFSDYWITHFRFTHFALHYGFTHFRFRHFVPLLTFFFNQHFTTWGTLLVRKIPLEFHVYRTYEGI